jgi:hypothetical protein
MVAENSWFRPDTLADCARITDNDDRFGYTVDVSSDADPLELREQRAEYFARWEAVETFKAHELAAMTEEKALQIIESLGLFAPAPPNRFNGLGLVEQQAIFHGLKR